MILFHGGPATLRVGGRILPPSVTGVPSCARYGAAGVCRTDRVYLTPSVDVARLFAALCPARGGAAVYKVEPEGELEADPDCDVPGLSFQCVSARIVKVHARISQSARRRIQRQVLG